MFNGQNLTRNTNLALFKNGQYLVICLSSQKLRNLFYEKFFKI